MLLCCVVCCVLAAFSFFRSFQSFVRFILPIFISLLLLQYTHFHSQHFLMNWILRAWIIRVNFFSLRFSSIFLSLAHSHARSRALLFEARARERKKWFALLFCRFLQVPLLQKCPAPQVMRCCCRCYCDSCGASMWTNFFGILYYVFRFINQWSRIAKLKVSRRWQNKTKFFPSLIFGEQFQSIFKCFVWFFLK